MYSVRGPSYLKGSNLYDIEKNKTNCDDGNKLCWRKHPLMTETHFDDGKHTVMTETHCDDGNTLWWRKHTVMTETHWERERILQEKVTYIMTQKVDNKRLPSILWHKSE